MNKWVHNVVADNIKRGKIDENEAEIYEYGYTLMLEKIIIFVICVVIALSLDAAWEVTALCITFIPLRVYSGGYHARSRWGCMMLSGAFVICGVLIVKMVQTFFNVWYYMVIELVCGILLVKRAPVGIEQRKLSDNEQSCYKKIVITIAGIEMLIGLVLFRYQNSIGPTIIAISSIFNSCAVYGESLLKREIK